MRFFLKQLRFLLFLLVYVTNTMQSTEISKVIETVPDSFDTPIQSLNLNSRLPLLLGRESLISLGSEEETVLFMPHKESTVIGITYAEQFCTRKKNKIGEFAEVILMINIELEPKEFMTGNSVTKKIWFNTPKQLEILLHTINPSLNPLVLQLTEKDYYTSAEMFVIKFKFESTPLKYLKKQNKCFKEEIKTIKQFIFSCNTNKELYSPSKRFIKKIKNLYMGYCRLLKANKKNDFFKKVKKELTSFYKKDRFLLSYWPERNCYALLNSREPTLCNPHITRLSLKRSIGSSIPSVPNKRRKCTIYHSDKLLQEDVEVFGEFKDSEAGEFKDSEEKDDRKSEDEAGAVVEKEGIKAPVLDDELASLGLESADEEDSYYFEEVAENHLFFINPY